MCCLCSCKRISTLNRNHALPYLINNTGVFVCWFLLLGLRWFFSCCCWWVVVVLVLLLLLSSSLIAWYTIGLTYSLVLCFDVICKLVLCYVVLCCTMFRFQQTEAVWWTWSRARGGHRESDKLYSAVQYCINNNTVRSWAKSEQNYYITLHYILIFLLKYEHDHTTASSWISMAWWYWSSLHWHSALDERVWVWTTAST